MNVGKSCQCKNGDIDQTRETPCHLADTRCTHIDVVAFVHRLDRASAPRITAFSLGIDRMHFPLTRDPTSLDLNATWGARARRDRKIFVCVCIRACVGRWFPRKWMLTSNSAGRTSINFTTIAIKARRNSL